MANSGCFGHGPTARTITKLWPSLTGTGLQTRAWERTIMRIANLSGRAVLTLFCGRE